MSGFESFGKIIIFIGIFIVVLGLLVMFWSKIPFLGKLPGDIFVQRGNFRFYFPLVTSIILSIVLTIIINVVIRLINK